MEKNLISFDSKRPLKKLKDKSVIWECILIVHCLTDKQYQALKEIEYEKFKFYHNNLFLIFEYIKRLKKENKEINILTVGTLMEKEKVLTQIGGGVFLAELIDKFINAVNETSPSTAIHLVKAFREEEKKNTKKILSNKLIIKQDYLEKLNNIQIQTRRFIDNNNFIPRRYVTVSSGPKGSGKTKVKLSYLKDCNVKLAFTSDNEITREDLKRQAEALQFPFDKIHWLNLKDVKGINQLANRIKEAYNEWSFDILWFDPLPSNIIKSSNDENFVGPLISALQKVADELDIAILISRNMSKTEYRNIENKIAGNFKWFTAPRSALMIFPCEQGSKYRKKDELKKSFLTQIASNVSGGTNKQLLFECEVKYVETISGQDKEAVFIQKSEKRHTLSGLIEITQAQKDNSSKVKMEIIEWISTQKNQQAPSRDIKPACSAITKTSPKYIAKLCVELKDEGKLFKIGINKDGSAGYSLQSPTPPDRGNKGKNKEK